MRLSKLRFLCTVLILLALVIVNLTAHSRALGASESVLWSFGNSADGNLPSAGLIMDATGNLYGTTIAGGAYGGGTVFRLTAQGSESILWNFGNGADGSGPLANLTVDASGNLYGTTIAGGTYTRGAVFKLTAQGNESVLWNFGNGTDGASPFGGLIIDASGNLYGTTTGGGAYAEGTVFKLTAQGSESVLWSFSNGTDGANPFAGLIIDASGDLYGTTTGGGVDAGGTVFKLTAQGNETVLWSFGNGIDGAYPAAGLIMDATGNLYGTTTVGGVFGCGTVFRLTPDGKESVLLSFGNGTDGADPLAGLIMDAGSNLYGTTFTNGTYADGTAFKLSPPFKSAGNWTESVLWNFPGNGTDGSQPSAGLIIDASRNLYGTTKRGGVYGSGTVFEISNGASSPQITLKPKNSPFPNTKVGSTSTANVRVRNTGTGQLIGTVNTPPAPFGLEGSGSFNLAPNAVAIITLTFTPTGSQQVHRIDTVASNAVNQSSVQFDLEGTGSP